MNTTHGTKCFLIFCHFTSNLKRIVLGLQLCTLIIADRKNTRRARNSFSESAQTSLVVSQSRLRWGAKLPHAIIQRHVVGSVPRRRTCIAEGKTPEWDIRHAAPAPPKISPSFVSGATRALLFPPRPDSRIHGFRPVSPQSC